MASYGMPHPNASWVGPGDEDSLDQRKQRLLDFLRGRGASQVGYHAMPLFGSGRAHGGVGLPSAALPSLTFNPFLQQIAGRNENFAGQMPAGLTAAAMQAAQAGPFAQAGGSPGIASAPGLAGGGPPGLGGGPPAMSPSVTPGVPAQSASPGVPTANPNTGATRMLAMANPGATNPDLLSNFINAPFNPRINRFTGYSSF